MGLSTLITSMAHEPSFRAAQENSTRNGNYSTNLGLRIPLLAGLLNERAKQTGSAQALLLITATSREAQAVSESWKSWAPEAQILNFPAWETLPHEKLSPAPQTIAQRLGALREMQKWRAERPQPLVLIAPVRAALQPLAPKLDQIETVDLVAGTRGHQLPKLAAQLTQLAYNRVDLVTRRGDYALRGGILDIFPPDAEHPVRAEFFGDELEQLRAFTVADQRSLPGDLEKILLPPSRELLITETVRKKAEQLLGEHPPLATMLSKIAEGIPVDGMESLTPLLLEKLVPLSDYLPPDAAIAVLSPERVATRAKGLAETNREFLEAAWLNADSPENTPVDLAGLATGDFLGLDELRLVAQPRNWWTISPFDSDSDETLAINGRAVPSFAGNADGAADHVAELVKNNWTVAVVAAGAGLAERAASVLGEREVASRIVETVPVKPESGVAYLVSGSIEAGFEQEETRLAVLAEPEFYGRTIGVDTRQPKKLASRRQGVVDPLQLAAGDYVVHETHGIGKFVELVTREVSGGTRVARGPLGTAHEKIIREYLVLEYAPSKRGQAGDRLYVPTDQLDQLSRYLGGEKPALSRMGGSDWAAAKGRARKAVRDIAVELVKLYSARQASTGHAFSPDTPWQHELEEAFPFVETPDQLHTIDEVKADMERAVPMDRLVSGDVGYGKTEIAVRAAFKAVQDNKQVAVLVPTTLLVRQHMETFAERFAGFPVHLRALSRFQSDKEVRETLSGISSGEVDVVIGTHRILSEKVRFKDLGLVVIDEEQRFGVQHKDALTKLKTGVDILAMSATPIPRTLEMAVTGIREMSTLATPPEDRHPILTFVGPRSQKQVAAAIRREMLREGQVFYVHNRVTSLSKVASELAELIPEARIGIAHGKLAEGTLEKVIVDFWERRYDVLVTTSIIETGIDIANANTLIIDDADRYGLSQLHQIRGRVGRGRERAYAYFLYDPEKPLTETAHNRLETIAANNELGGGMQIALKDLEIRGAGNLLGAEQSGHIAGVGFDLYLRMIGEAVQNFRGEKTAGVSELRLELPIDARIPENYIESERLRLEAYQKLSTAASPGSADDAISRVAEEFTDRYGEPPEAVNHLITVSGLRRQAAQLELSEVASVGGRLRLSPVELPDSMQVRLNRLYPGMRLLHAQKTALVPMPESASNAEVLNWVAGVLSALAP